jgi:hypothetical protein
MTFFEGFAGFYGGANDATAQEVPRDRVSVFGGMSDDDYIEGDGLPAGMLWLILFNHPLQKFVVTDSATLQATKGVERTLLTG